MMNSLANLAALGPGLGTLAEHAADVRAFAQRRVDHLKKKVEAGSLAPDQLRHRLLTRFGPSAKNVVDGGGLIDFDRLQELVSTQQAEKLQTRLEELFGEEAGGIVSPDGTIDQDKFNTLQTTENLDRLHARLSKRFSDRADGMVGNDGSIDVDALRELFAFDENERPYDPTRLHQGAREMTSNGEPSLDMPPHDTNRSRVSPAVTTLSLALNR